MAIIAIIVVSFGVYFNALFNDFVYDDTYQVLQNQWIKSIKSIPDILSSSVWSFTPQTIGARQNYYRPLMHITYMINYHIFGLKPWGFHLTNIMLHTGVSILIFYISSLLFNQTEVKKSNSQIITPAFIAALLFSTHPIHTEAVTWVAGLPDVSFTFFYLTALFLHIRTDKISGKRLIFSSFFFFLALLSKETALTFPVLLILYDIYVKKYKKPIPVWLKIYSPYLLIIGLYMGMRIYAIGGIVPQKGMHNLTGFQYLINVFPLFTQYLHKLILPANLNIVYVFKPIHSILELKFIVSILIASLFCWLIYKTMKVNRIVFACLLLILIPLLPALYISALPENVFAERYLYLPSTGFVIIVSYGLVRIAELLNYKQAATVCVLITIPIVIAYSYGTINRNKIWFNEYTLWTDTVKKSPDSSLAHNNLGSMYYAKGVFEKALDEYKEALRIKPANYEALYNIGTLYHNKNRLDEAIRFYIGAIQINPYYFSAISNLGVAYSEKGEYENAIKELNKAVALWPDAEGYYNLGALHERMGHYDMAIKEFNNALRINPDFTPAIEALSESQ